MASQRWPYYLPVNPCCDHQHSGCDDNCTNPCNRYWSQSDHLAYNGPPLSCTGIDNCDTLSVCLQKIEELMCVLLAYHTTTTTSSTSSTTTTTTTTSPTTTTTTTGILLYLVAPVYSSDTDSDICAGVAYLSEGIYSLIPEDSLRDGVPYFYSN
jgi:hypothetical protein